MISIITTVEELEALDQDTVLVNRDKWGDDLILTAREWFDELGDCDDLPLAIIATGTQLHAARTALRRLHRTEDQP